jgi:predicted phosphoribosyltransferase
MKNFNNKLLAVLAIIPAIGLAGPFSYDAEVPVDHVFSPAGFNSNDNAEVVVTGYLPNLCYRAPKSTVSVVNGKIAVSVKATKNVVGMGFCVNIIVPYTESIQVGTLDKGKYQIAVNEKSNWPKTSNISIAEISSNSIDEAVFANVDEVTRMDSGSRRVSLKGYNPSDCFELKEIVVLDNGVDTYSVLPKMKQVKTSCPKKMIPFTYEFEVPEKLEADKVLLHVRVMDGRSVNAFFSNRPQDE